MTLGWLGTLLTLLRLSILQVNWLLDRQSLANSRCSIVLVCITWPAISTVKTTEMSCLAIYRKEELKAQVIWKKKVVHPHTKQRVSRTQRWSHFPPSPPFVSPVLWLYNLSCFPAFGFPSILSSESSISPTCPRIVPSISSSLASCSSSIRSNFFSTLDPRALF